MKVFLSPKAEKDLKKLPKVDQIAVAKKIRSIRDNKPTTQEEKLSGYQNIFRIRIGNYRVVYRKTLQEIFIVVIRHRKEVYRLLAHLLQ